MHAAPRPPGRRLLAVPGVRAKNVPRPNSTAVRQRGGVVVLRGSPAAWGPRQRCRAGGFRPAGGLAVKPASWEKVPAGPTPSSGGGRRLLDGSQLIPKTWQKRPNPGGSYSLPDHDFEAWGFLEIRSKKHPYTDKSAIFFCDHFRHFPNVSKPCDEFFDSAQRQFLAGK